MKVASLSLAALLAIPASGKPLRGGAKDLAEDEAAHTARVLQGSLSMIQGSAEYAWDGKWPATTTEATAAGDWSDWKGSKSSKATSSKSSKSSSKDGGWSAPPTGKACGPVDYEGIWTYISQGGGTPYITMITCPEYLHGDCQIADNAINQVDCGVIGTITSSGMFRNDDGNCAFKPVALDLLNPTAISVPQELGCPSVTSGARSGDFLLFLYGSGNQDLNAPMYYNKDAPRHGFKINK